MSNNGRKESDVQAAEGPPDPELESMVAPQGYDPDLVDDVATMETPAQQRRTAIRFMIMMLVLVAIGFWFCRPVNVAVPELTTAPYGIYERPQPPSDRFLEDSIPTEVGDFILVDLRTEQIFEDPFVGEIAVQATYIDEVGNPASVVVIEAESYINARRYLENYKKLLDERANLTEWQENLFIDKNFIQWSAPDFADRAYGLAWNNDRYLIAVTSPVSGVQQLLAEAFPY